VIVCICLSLYGFVDVCASSFQFLGVDMFFFNFFCSFLLSKMFVGTCTYMSVFLCVFGCV